MRGLWLAGSLLLVPLAGTGVPGGPGDDRDARYPLLIDPYLQAAKLTASDGATDDSLGFSVAIDGDVVVVGAKGDDVGTNADQGSAYVFVKPEGGWVNAAESARLTASDGDANDQFGVSVAVSGDTVVVGAWFDDDAGPGGPGSAYVFVRPAGGWAGALHETARLTASDRLPGDLFGASVAISGDMLAVGAPLDDFGDTFSAQGSAYVFMKPPGGWTDATESAKLSASDKMPGDRLGSAVAVGGDTVVAGAPLDSIGANVAQGSAYVFVAPGAGLGERSETARLTAADGAAGDSFGYSVAVLGDTVVSGAILHAAAGAAYVFVKPAAGWVSTSSFDAELTASDGAKTDRFGESVAMAGGTVVAGARSGPGANHPDQGAAYVFVKPAGGWTTTSVFDAKLTAADGAQSDDFGASVGLSGETVLVGAWGDQFGGGPFQGSAYVFIPDTTLCGGLTPTLVGTPGNDTLTGTRGRDVIDGLGGDDVIYGLDGDDVICGGAGMDTLLGGNGTDVLVGGADNDTLYGNGGGDVLEGDAGDDTLTGGRADDTMRGGEGDDTLDGGLGNDALDGGPGTDICHGNEGEADSGTNCETQTGIP
jgi:Ca2+-binding RTX toxin-like protein